MTRLTLAAALLATTSGALVASAIAQEPAEILLDASNALANAPGGTAGFELDATTDSSLAKTLPTASGRVLWRRAEGDDPAKVRLTGSGRHRRDADPRDFDALYADGEVSFLDHERKELVRRSVDGRADARLSAISEVDLRFLTENRPLDEALRAVSVESDGQATIDGEVCDVVLVTLPPAAEGEARRKYTKERWAIARSDHLPRRVERIGEYPMIGTITVTTTLTDLKTTPPEPGKLTMTTPDGYREVSAGGSRVGIRAGHVESRPHPPVTPTPQHERSEPDRPSYPAAPAFELTGDNDTTYTNESQAGRVTVVYFWGTWCIGCTPFSPLVSQLAADFEGKPVDVLGAAVHEKSPTAPRERVRDAGYKYLPVAGGDAILTPLRVRVYPTIVVIGPENGVRVVEHATPDATPEEVMQRVRDAVNAAIPSDG